MIQPSFAEKEKIYKTKDIKPALKFYGSILDKLKTKYPNRAKAITLGYRAYKSGLNETQIRSTIDKKIEDRDISNILEHKELKDIRSWSVSSKLNKEDRDLELLRTWCKKIGAICLIADISQKDLINLANEKFKDELDCTIPKEF